MTTKLEERVLTPEMVMETGREIRKLWLANLTQEEVERIVETVPLEKRLAGLAPEDRLAGLAPEDRLAGLAPEDMPKLIKQIEAFLKEQQSSGK